MKSIREIISNLLNNFLKFRKNDIVSVAAEIYNLADSKEALIEMDMVEAIYLELIRKKTFPLLNLSLQKIQQSLKEEFSAYETVIPEKIDQNFIDNIDIFIEVGWKKLSRQNLNDNDLQKSAVDPQIFYWHRIFQNKKDLVFLNYPTPELADNLQIPYKDLLKTYLMSIDCNYEKLKQQAETLKDDFFSYANYRITTQEEKINIKIMKDRYQLFMGTALDHQITILPAGIIEFPMEKIALDGIFLAEKVYYKNLVFNNVKLNFADGVIRYISFKSDQKDNYSLQNKIMSSQKECYFSLGFNTQITDYTGFYLYDRCISGNISLKFFDQDFYPIVLSNLKAEIKKRKRIFMSGINK